ncbi:AAA family ATPase [Azospirillum sp. B506]|uniref:AAA family ATPase n=1 Tax=Azospirillum sp. B506 TaxID=137721 RepID=UPI0011DCA9CD
MTDFSWTLHIEELGKLSEAEIQLAPLTIIVGKNNSGKSYLSSLLWALANPEIAIFRGQSPVNKQYRACIAWIRKAARLPKDEVRVFDDAAWRCLRTL